VLNSPEFWQLQKETHPDDGLFQLAKARILLASFSASCELATGFFHERYMAPSCQRCIIHPIFKDTTVT
jgi:hypothetical protein